MSLQMDPRERARNSLDLFLWLAIVGLLVGLAMFG